MKNPYEPDENPDDQLNRILGFGERSIHKSYYPELQKTILDLKTAEERYYNIFHNALNGIFQFDPQGLLLDANPAFMDIVGYESMEEAQKVTGDMVGPLFNNRKELLEIIASLRNEQKVEKRVVRIIRKDKRLIWVSINAISVFDKSGRMIYIEGFIEDVTGRVEHEESLKKMAEELEALVSEKTRELEEANRKLRVLSNTDALTGIANRRYFDEILDYEWRRASRLGHSVALAMLDIDLFKYYNDLYGHLAGDDCLRRIALILSAHSRRAGDFSARYGGEEFVLILPGFEAGPAAELAETIRSSLESLGISHKRSPYGFLTISIGVAAGLPGSQYSTPEQLLKKADDAMYKAKRQGGNMVVRAE